MNEFIQCYKIFFIQKFSLKFDVWILSEYDSINHLDQLVDYLDKFIIWD